MDRKAVLIGPIAVGKTSLSNKIQYNCFSSDYQSTVGAGNYIYQTTINHQQISLNIWDTAGMEQYKALGPIYYRGAHAVILVFDLTRENTAKELKGWLSNFTESIKTEFYGIVVGNKLDLVQDENSEFILSMKEWAKTNNFDFILTSAKRGLNVTKLFDMVAEGASKVSDFDKSEEIEQEQKKSCC
ncbi:small GTP-binding protein [Histomonas meleagridis]|uniref:small GTP-binding protein n=1 Tax=Histomonas meleagridis TaxID=135588 RepID=UPI0035596372|nr:small GTP-binding protein [Histomonas meleagridis]KAH0800117.1 small GTP-binding protein [Histomonas meleagridis]